MTGFNIIMLSIISVAVMTVCVAVGYRFFIRIVATFAAWIARESFAKGSLPCFSLSSSTVKNDEELNKYFGGVTIASGGVLPNVHDALLKKKGKKDASQWAPRLIPHGAYQHHK
jgi:hypothetical protein